ncbi:MAG: VOC family protein, partial [Bacteroidota bacterium]
MENNFSHAATVLPVANMDKALSFYKDRLGFEVTFTWEDPICYAVLKRGGVSLHLSLTDDKEIKESKRCMMYIFVHDIDAIYKTCLKKGVHIKNIPETRGYVNRLPSGSNMSKSFIS